MIQLPGLFITHKFLSGIDEIFLILDGFLELEQGRQSEGCILLVQEIKSASFYELFSFMLKGRPVWNI